MVTRPEKFLSRSVPPGSILSVLLTCSVSSATARTAGALSASRAKASKYLRMGAWTEEEVLGFYSSNVLRFWVQGAGIDRHPDDRVDAEGVELVDFALGGDAAGSCQAAGRGVPDGHHRLEVRAPHQPFGVHVGIEELVAERLERAHRVGGGQRQLGLPAVNHDAAVAAVHRRDD